MDGNQVPTIHLTLFVDSADRRSLRIVERVEELCADCLQDEYELVVVDAPQHPEMVETFRVMVLPTLDVLTPGAHRHRMYGIHLDSGSAAKVFKLFKRHLQISLNTENQLRDAERMLRDSAMMLRDSQAMIDKLNRSQGEDPERRDA